MKLGIRFKLISSIFTLMVVVTWLTATVLIKDTTKRLSDHHKEAAFHQAKILAEVSVDAFISKDFEVLDRWLDSSIISEEYAYAALVKPNGLVLKHTDNLAMGETIVTAKQPVINEIQYKKYLGRPVTEILYSSKLGGKHVANVHVAYYLDIDNEYDKKTYQHLIVILLMAGACLMVGVFFIADKIIAPIRLLTNDISGFTLERGVRFSPTLCKRDDEVGELARSYDEMSYKLVVSFKDLKLAHKKALLAKEEAEYANKAKSEFIANISHEFRTPMHAIMGFSELGISMKDEPEKKLEYFEAIKTSATRLMSLIDGLLNIVKLESGKYLIDHELYSLLPIIEQCREKERESLATKKIELVVGGATDAKAEFDIEGIYQVIESLLSNAIKYSNENSKIVINIEVVNVANVDSLHFSIKNEGVEIPSDELLSIFEDFVQSSITDDGSGGVGIGLSISKKIIDVHNGKIWAENAQDVTGAIFHIVLPCQQKPL